MIYCRYRDLSVTYDKVLQREKVIQKLTSYIEGDKEWINDNVTHFCAALENVRKGILNLEGWNNAWPLFDAFLRDIMKFDHDKCFVISGYFFEVIFDVSSKENIREETFFMKTKLKTKIHQINPYETNKGMDALQIKDNESMHFDGRIDRQIRIPIMDVDEYLRKLKGNG